VLMELAGVYLWCDGNDGIGGWLITGGGVGCECDGGVMVVCCICGVLYLWCDGGCVVWV